MALSQVSEDCRNLLKRIFVHDPAERITVEGICNHPWFKMKLPGGAVAMNDKYGLNDQLLQVTTLTRVMKFLSCILNDVQVFSHAGGRARWCSFPFTSHSAVLDNFTAFFTSNSHILTCVVFSCFRFPQVLLTKPRNHALQTLEETTALVYAAVAPVPSIARFSIHEGAWADMEFYEDVDEDGNY